MHKKNYSANYSTTNTQEEDRFVYMMMCDALGRRFDKIALNEKKYGDNDENVRFKVGTGNLFSMGSQHMLLQMW